MIAAIEAKFDDILAKHPDVAAFMYDRQIIGQPRKVESRWRSANDIYIVPTAEGPVVVKKINQDDADATEEVEYFKRFTNHYPGFAPQIHAHQGSTFAMEYICGQDMIALMKQPLCQVQPLLTKAATSLRNIYRNAEKNSEQQAGDATSQIEYTHKYTPFCPLPENPLPDVLPPWEKTLAGYPPQFIHNDLNSANFRVTSEGEARSIDPRADTRGIKDVAKDLGRLIASSTCAAHDNGYPTSDTIQVVKTLAFPWKDHDPSLPQRVAFYIGQSFVSFARWDMENLAKGSLFLVGVDLLQHGPKAFPTFEHLSDQLGQTLQQKAYSRYEPAIV